MQHSSQQPSQSGQLQSQLHRSSQAVSRLSVSWKLSSLHKSPIQQSVVVSPSVVPHVAEVPTARQDLVVVLTLFSNEMILYNG